MVGPAPTAGGAAGRSLWLQPMARRSRSRALDERSPSTSPTPASPRAAPPSGSSPPGACSVDGETVTDPARDVGASSARDASTGARSPAPSQRVVYALNKPLGVVSTARDTHGRPTVVDAGPAPAACASTRSGASTPTAAG